MVKTGNPKIACFSYFYKIKLLILKCFKELMSQNNNLETLPVINSFYKTKYQLF